MPVPAQHFNLNLIRFNNLNFQRTNIIRIQFFLRSKVNLIMQRREIYLRYFIEWAKSWTLLLTIESEFLFILRFQSIFKSSIAMQIQISNSFITMRDDVPYKKKLKLPFVLLLVISQWKTAISKVHVTFGNICYKQRNERPDCDFANSIILFRSHFPSTSNTVENWLLISEEWKGKILQKMKETTKWSFRRKGKKQ